MASMTESSTAPSLPATMACPTCGAGIDYDRRFTPWCAACDWNVAAGADVSAKPPSRIQRRRTALARRLAEGSFAQVAGRTAERPPRLTPGTVTLWLASVAIVGIWLALLGVGVLFVVAGAGLVFTVIGVLMVVLAVVTRPRIAPDPDHPLARDAAPELYRLVDDISAELRAPRVAMIGVDGDWNAYTYRFGLRQRTAIVIGLPYWHALADQERVALLAHEVGHTVNGDTTRGIVQGNAELLLRHWAFMTEPDDIVDASGGLIALASVPANVAMLGISLTLTGLADALFALAFPARLRAELYADRLAATIAGRHAASAEQAFAYHVPAYLRALAAVTIRRPPAADLYDEILVQIAATPPAEIERLRRKERIAPFTFDQTHPPTPVREAMLLRLPVDRAPRIVATPERLRAIDAELATLRPAVTREQIEEYRDAVLS